MATSDINYLARAFLAKLEEDNLVVYKGATKFQRAFQIVDDIDPYAWLKRKQNAT